MYFHIKKFFLMLVFHVAKPVVTLAVIFSVASVNRLDIQQVI